MGFLRDVGKGFVVLFADDPSQYVESSDWEGLKTEVAVAMKNGDVSTSQAKELMGTYKVSIVDKAKDFLKKLENSIRLLPSDKADFRSDSTIEEVSKPVQIKTVSTLENTTRQPGGHVEKERDVE